MTLTPKALELIARVEEREKIAKIRKEHEEWMERNMGILLCIKGYQAPQLDEYREYHGFSLD